MGKVGKVLTKKEIERLREILNKELPKPKNKKYSATLLMYIQDLGEIAFHEHYLSILYFLRFYRTKIDMKIKTKLQTAYKNRTLDFEKYKQKVKQKFYRYKRKDYPTFLKKSEYFFSLYKNPFDFSNMRNKDYLNRVYLGLGFEFLLKAIFLKKGYIINKLNLSDLSHPVKQSLVRKADLNAKVYELGYFIDLLPKIKPS